jgi:integrase
MLIKGDHLIQNENCCLEAMARFILATGLRKSNVINLKRADVDLIRKCA